MSPPDPQPVRSLLDPVERTSEVLFGVFMALTFTGAASVASAGREELRDALAGALGCNLAWGLVDGVMHLVNLASARGRGLVALQSLRRAKDSAHGRGILADALPPVLLRVMRPEELDDLARRLVALPDLPRRPWLRARDYLDALAIACLVFASTFPLVVPFLLLDDARQALRWSHAVALLLLFACGARLGQHAGRPPLRAGLWMVLGGSALVALIIALGG